MTQVSSKLRSWVNRHNGDEGFIYWCQGCDEAHSVRVKSPSGNSCWGFNGSLERPTFTPSVLTTNGHYIDNKQPGNCYCDWHIRYPDKEPMKWKCTHCHTFITDGQVQFLSDCSHALAGQTLPLPDLPQYLQDETGSAD